MSSYIGRASLDGSNVNPSFITGPSSPSRRVWGVAVDANYVYWTNNDNTAITNSIGRASLDGSNVNQNFMTFTVIPGVSGLPVGLAVDSNHIYWTDAISGYIGRASLDGSNGDQNFLAVTAYWGVAVDANYVYWGNNRDGSIGRASLDGSNVNENFTSPNAGYHFGVAVDAG